MEPRRYTIDDYFAAASAREMIGEEETRAVVEEQARRVASGRDAWSLGRIIPIVLLLGCVAVALVAWELSAPDGSRSGLFDDDGGMNLGESDRSNHPPLPFDRDEPLDTSTAALSDSAWGYRFVPGQRLRFERVYRSNPYGDDKVSTTRMTAVIIVESVDSEGNITMIIDEERIETWSGKKAKAVTQKRRYRATMTSMGEAVRGEVLSDPSRERYFRNANRPSFGGGMLRTELSAVRSTIDCWFPRWPERAMFDGRGRGVLVDSLSEPVHQMEEADYNDPSRHLDTIDGALLFVSAKARGIVAEGVPPVEEPDDEDGGDVIKEVPNIGTGPSKQDDEYEQSRDSLRAVTIFAGTIRWDRYRLVESPDDIRVPAITMIDSVERHDWFDRPENARFRWYTRTLLVFRRSDGAPLRVVSTGWSEHDGRGDGWHEETIRLVDTK